jgi:hypothetical protein
MLYLRFTAKNRARATVQGFTKSGVCALANAYTSFFHLDFLDMSCFFPLEETQYRIGQLAVFELPIP